MSSTQMLQIKSHNMHCDQRISTSYAEAISSKSGGSLYNSTQHAAQRSDMLTNHSPAGIQMLVQIKQIVRCTTFWQKLSTFVHKKGILCLHEAQYHYMYQGLPSRHHNYGVRECLPSRHHNFRVQEWSAKYTPQLWREGIESALE